MTSMSIAITGGATGIGAATCALLKQRGYHVTAFDISQPEQNVDRWVPLDLSEPASVVSALEKVEGPFDALISNAGLPPRAGMSAQILMVNYFGLVQFTEGMLQRLAPGGAIVNVASRAGAHWRENVAEVKALMKLPDLQALQGFIEDRGIDEVRAYNLSKEAVIAWTMGQTERLVSLDLRANSVSPAAVATGILDDFVAAFGERVARNIARAGRPGKPEEIAEIIAFLASPNSHWLKGVDIVPDGGMGAMATTDALRLAD